MDYTKYKSILGKPSYLMNKEEKGLYEKMKNEEDKSAFEALDALEKEISTDIWYEHTQP